MFLFALFVQTVLCGPCFLNPKSRNKLDIFMDPKRGTTDRRHGANDAPNLDDGADQTTTKCPIYVKSGDCPTTILEDPFLSKRNTCIYGSGSPTTRSETCYDSNFIRPDEWENCDATVDDPITFWTHCDDALIIDMLEYSDSTCTVKSWGDLDDVRPPIQWGSDSKQAYCLSTRPDDYKDLSRARGIYGVGEGDDKHPYNIQRCFPTIRFEADGTITGFKDETQNCAGYLNKAELPSEWCDSMGAWEICGINDGVLSGSGYGCTFEPGRSGYCKYGPESGGCSAFLNTNGCTETRKTCCEYVANYGVRPHNSWGSTPDSEKGWWDANNCNDLVTGGQCTLLCGDGTYLQKNNCDDQEGFHHMDATECRTYAENDLYLTFRSAGSYGSDCESCVQKPGGKYVYFNTNANPDCSNNWKSVCITDRPGRRALRKVPTKQDVIACEKSDSKSSEECAALVDKIFGSMHLDDSQGHVLKGPGFA